PNRLHWMRGLVVGVSLILLLALLAGAAVFILTGTDWGRERIRRYGQNWINGQIHGTAKIGRISGNLLTGVVIHDFSIVDTAGKPFVAVESVRGSYSVVSLFKKHLWFRDVVAVRPLIVLDRPPEGAWNWQRIFPRDT